ncbi:hypothetical protein A2U01_0116032, partial [Trifolium medium]|nr:hypothetical protein [Trifolium medium]
MRSALRTTLLRSASVVRVVLLRFRSSAALLRRSFPVVVFSG